jgi:hypothetical protein
VRYALAAYCRDPLAAALAIELAWLEFADEQVLATLKLDPEMLPGAAHHRLMTDGDVKTTTTS